MTKQSAEAVEQEFFTALIEADLVALRRILLMSYRGSTVFVCLLLVATCVCFQARRGETTQHPPARAAAQAAALQGEAAIQQLKTDGGYASLAAAMAADAAAGDQFGAAVALSGNTAVIGAPFDDVTGVDEGSAYVFVRNGASWSLQQKLNTTDGAANDGFGFSVVLSGDTVVVGALFDDIGTTADQGSAYVFTRSGTVWTQQQRLTANDGAANDHFGASVALDGDTVVVGAQLDTNGANGFQGSAYVFTRGGTVWTQQQKLTAADGAAADFFGHSVALSGDTVVVGAFADKIGVNGGQGSAYVFTRGGEVWMLQQKLTASDGAAFDGFDSSVALSGDTVVVGAGSDDFGLNRNQGSAYVFTRSFTPSGAAWTQQQKLIASDGAAGDQFGASVALSGDTVVVGADGDDIGANGSQGSAYVFTRGGAVWTQQQQLTASDGTGPYQKNNSATSNFPFLFRLCR